jgi:hypothetical protein
MVRQHLGYGGNEDVSGSTRPKSADIAPGSRVILREGAFGETRQHMRAHALRKDAGAVVAWRRASWANWVHVKFDGCTTVHRLAPDEISVTQRPKS